MLKIDSGNGIELDAKLVIQTKHKGAPRLMIDLENVTIARAAQALDGAKELVVTDGNAPGVTTIYKDYSRIVYAGYAEQGGVRMTLERS